MQGAGAVAHDQHDAEQRKQRDRFRGVAGLQRAMTKRSAAMASTVAPTIPAQNAIG